MDLFDLVAKITLDTSEYEQGLNNAESKADTFGSKLGSAVSKGSKLAVAGISAVATGATIMGKKFIDGINATAQYGDNVDKMSQKIGISAESYQKWDYVMQRAGTSVDNLKMGMKTLSKQAEANSDSFQKLGISQEEVKNLSQEDLFEKTIKGLASMEAGTERTTLATELLGKAGADLGPLLNEGSDAIEEQMEIAEKYGMVMSDEAVKASADFEDSLTTMSMTMQGLKNRMMGEFLPAVTDVTDGLGKMFAGDMSGADDIVKGFDGIIDKVTEVLPKIMDIGEKIFEGLSESIIKSLPKLFETATTIVLSLAEYFIEALPMITDTATQIITTLVSGIGQALPTLIPAAVDAIVAITQGLLENLPLIIEAGLQLIGGLVLGLAQAIPQLLEAAPELISTLVEGLLQSIDLLISAAGELITSLVNGLVENLPMIISSAFDIISALVEGITQNLPTIIETAIQLIVTLIEGLTQALPQIIEYMPYIIDAIVNGLVNNFGMLIECALQIVLTLVDAIANNLPKIVEIGVQLLEKLIGGILKFIKKMPETAKKLISSFKKAFTDIKWKDIGTHILEGIANGLSKGARIIIDAAKNAAAQAFNAVCDFLGIHSPSRLFRDQVGKNMALGLAEGFEDYMPYDEIEDALSFDYNVPQFETEMSVSKVGTDDVAYGAGDNITINVYATERQDERRVAEEVQKQFVLWEKQRKAVFA